MRDNTKKVLAFIQNKDQILLIKRPKEPFTGFWTCAGGTIEENETPEQAVIREAKEETGLDVKIIQKLDLYDDTYYELIISNHVFLCEPLSNEIKIDQHECSDIKWFKTQEVKKPNFKFVPTSRRYL